MLVLNSVGLFSVIKECTLRTERSIYSVTFFSDYFSDIFCSPLPDSSVSEIAAKDPTLKDSSLIGGGGDEQK